MINFLQIENNNCISDTAKLQVSVNNKPSATFNYSGSNCVDSLLIFNSSFQVPSTNPPKWYWFFGDGKIDSSSTANSSLHAYSNSQTNVTIKHFVSFGGACKSDTTSIVIPLISNNSIDTFKISTDTLCDNKKIVFNAIPFNNIASWKWQIGNFIDRTPTIQIHVAKNQEPFALKVGIDATTASYTIN